jgi:hypothetical protein
LQINLSAIYNQTCPACGGRVDEAFAQPNNNDLDDIVNKLIKSLHSGNSHKFDKGMIQFTAEQLMQGMLTGYGKNFTNVDYNSPDWKMLENLENNVYQFSAAKNFQQIRLMTSLLIDNGKPRSFSDFRNKVIDLNIKFNKTWLKTEYNLAIAGGQMASKWVDFADGSMLKYSTAGDANVRDSHAALDGVKKPKNDNFWAIHYPPNGFNCRCNVVETSSKQPTDDDKIPSVEIQPMFRTNLAKSGLVFPKNHPFFIGIDKKKIEAIVLSMIPNRANYKSNLKFFNSLSQEEYPENIKKFYPESGGFYAFHKDHNLNPITGYSELITANAFAKKGFAILFNDESKSKKTADFKDINSKKLYEIKLVKKVTHRSSKEVILHADLKKAHFPVAVVEGEIDYDILFAGFNSGFKFTKYKECYYVVDGELKVYKK